MTLTIFGATTSVGKIITNMALAKNYTVKAFGRDVVQLIDKDLHDKNFVAIKGYVFDEADVLKAVKNSDVVVSCIEGATNGTDKTRSLGIKNIIAQMKKAGVKKLIALGGVGVLQKDEEQMLLDSEDFDVNELPVSIEHLTAYNFLQQSNLNSVFVCPSKIIDQPFDGHYKIATTYATLANSLQPVSAGNIADFMIQCAESNQHNGCRVGIWNL